MIHSWKTLYKFFNPYYAAANFNSPSPYLKSIMDRGRQNVFPMGVGGSERSSSRHLLNG